MHFRIALALLWQRSSFFRKPTRPSLPLRKAPPLISVFSPQGRRGKPLLLVARNRYALRLAAQSKVSPDCADGTAYHIRKSCFITINLLHQKNDFPSKNNQILFSYNSLNYQYFYTFHEEILMDSFDNYR